MEVVGPISGDGRHKLLLISFQMVCRRGHYFCGFVAMIVGGDVPERSRRQRSVFIAVTMRYRQQ